MLTEDALGLFSIGSTVCARIARSRLSLYFIFSVRQSSRYDQSASVIQVWSVCVSHPGMISLRQSSRYDHSASVVQVWSLCVSRPGMISLRQSSRYDQSASVIQVWSLYKTHWDTVSLRQSTASTVDRETRVERETNKMQLIWCLLSIVYLKFANTKQANEILKFKNLKRRLQ